MNGVLVYVVDDDDDDDLEIFEVNVIGGWCFEIFKIVVMSMSIFVLGVGFVILLGGFCGMGLIS